jgi:hypothetical protein
MDLDFIVILMVLNMKASGGMINNMVRDMNNGLMEQVIGDIILIAKRMDRVYLGGQTVHFIKVNSSLTLFTELGISIYINNY